MSDDRYKTLSHADEDNISRTQQRYQLIATTIDHTVAQLEKIIDAGDGLKGKYAEKIKKDAVAVKDSLKKAQRRYDDVAAEILKYEPDLKTAQAETKLAQGDREDAKRDLVTATAKPEAQKSPDGTISPEEQTRVDQRQKEIDAANGKLTAAKNKLTAALDALDVAGKRFGDAVNCDQYKDDGLTDSAKDKFLLFLKSLSKIFGWIALVLTVISFFIPGLNLVVIAGLAAGAVLLISDSILYANGDASWKEVFLDAIGLGFAGLGAAMAKIAKWLKGFANWNIFPSAGRPPTAPFRPSAGDIPLTSWGGPRPAAVPKLGFFETTWSNIVTYFKADFTALMDNFKNWKNLLPGNAGTFQDFLKTYLSNLFDKPTRDTLIAALGHGNLSLKGWWTLWAGATAGLNLGAGVGYAIYGIYQTQKDG